MYVIYNLINCNKIVLQFLESFIEIGERQASNQIIWYYLSLIVVRNNCYKNNRYEQFLLQGDSGTNLDHYQIK